MTMNKESYSEKHPVVLDEQERSSKANKIVAVIMDYYKDKGELGKLRCLDVGCSGGIITNYLANYFGKVTGVDIDAKALAYAKSRFKRKNLSFKLNEATEISAKDNSFDVVVCNHTYQYIPDKQMLLNEIYRLLKPCGFCYFAASTRFSHKESAFLSWLPKRIRSICLGNKTCSAEYMTYYGLRKIVSDFEVVDYSIIVLKGRDKFFIGRGNAIPGLLPTFLLKALIYFFPTYVWILKKPEQEKNKRIL